MRNHLRSIIFSIAVLFATNAIAQDLNEGCLLFKETPEAITPGTPVKFKLVDTSNTLPDSTVVRIDWLDEGGHLLNFALLYLQNGVACYSFDNNKILKGPTLLRGYFFSKGNPRHIARQFVHINAASTVPEVLIPDSLQPFIINKPFATVDNFYGLELIINEKYRSGSIQYQLVDLNGELQDIAGVDRINDSLLRINELSFVGKGSMRIYVNSEREFRDYDDFSIRVAAPVGSIVWSNDSISRKAMEYMVNALAVMGTNTNRRGTKETGVTQYTKEGLPDVVVTGIRKSRKQEIEDKYVKNGMFRHINTSTAVVFEDPLANPSLSVVDYLLLKFPLLQPRNGNLLYRGAPVAFFLDEVPFDDLTALNIRDIAFVSFIKASIRGLNGPSARSVGRAGGGGSINAFGGEGGTGTIAIYTKKGDEEEVDLKRKRVSLPFVGISVGSCK